MLCCPHCRSERIVTHDIAQKTGCAIGLIGGTASGIAGALSGAESGAVVGLVGGPLGVALGAFSGAVLGALVGGAAGATTGAQLGHAVDRYLLDNCRCLDCGLSFSPLPEAPDPYRDLG